MVLLLIEHASLDDYHPLRSQTSTVTAFFPNPETHLVSILSLVLPHYSPSDPDLVKTLTRLVIGSAPDLGDQLHEIFFLLEEVQ